MAFKAAPANALATLACKRASVCVYVYQRDTSDAFPYGIRFWDKDYNDGEGQYIYDNAFVSLSDAVNEASRIFANQID